MSDWLLKLASLLDNQYESILLLLTAVVVLNSKKKTVFLAALVATLLLIIPLKLSFHEARPCEYQAAIAFCDGTFGFPSGHAATAAVLALGALGSYAFFLFLPAVYFVGFTRVYLGVHTISQVSGGVALGAMVYFLLDCITEAYHKRTDKKKAPKTVETRRQLFHLFFGVAIACWALLTDFLTAELTLLAALFFGTLFLNALLLKISVKPVERLMERFERKSAPFPGKGAFYYVVGALFLFSFSKTWQFALAGLTVLAVSDALSTLVGVRYGKHKLFWNSKKSWEGFLAFFASGAACASLFVGLPVGIGFALVLAVVETVDFQIDDNLLISIAAVALGFILG